MRTQIAVLFLLALPNISLAAPKLAPAKNWRLGLSKAQVRSQPAGAAALKGLASNAGQAWPGQKAKSLKIELDLRKHNKDKLLIVVEFETSGPKHTVTLKALKKTGDKGKVVEQLSIGPRDKRRRKGPRIAHLTFPAKYAMAHIELGGEEAAQVKRLRLYRLDKKGRNDYWLFLGASLTTAGGNPDLFHELITQNMKGYDPYVANEAVSGWASRHLLKALPDLLRKHRHARYVTIHMGGNNVSATRPYPGGAKRLAADLQAILQMIRKAGKIPILARLSYRAYKKSGRKGAVPPEENGSGPYVKAIYDPLIKRYCKDFYDSKEKRGVVDFYNYYKAHQDLIGGDGIHLKMSGYKTMCRLWAGWAGGLVYKGKAAKVE